MEDAIKADEYFYGKCALSTEIMSKSSENVELRVRSLP